MVRFIVSVLMASILCSCASGSYDPASVRPVFQARNSPSPVPVPLKKPDYRTVQSNLRASARSGITVQAGQTLYGISRAYGVSLRDLVAANRLRSPYTLSIGQRLVLPSVNTYTVKRGDTGYSISRKFGVTVSSLMAANRIRAPYTLAVGQKLSLPGGASAQTSTSAPRPATPTSTTSTNTRVPQAKPSAPARPTSSRPRPTVPARTSSQFAWPTKGTIASRFGPKEGGLHNDGINILARAGSPVRAAEAGVVVYASNALEGYGNLLLLKHSGGYITAYAHNERLLVGEGATVKRGDVIARVGISGGVTEPQLHFEIRRGRRALDPMQHLEASGGAAP